MNTRNSELLLDSVYTVEPLSQFYAWNYGHWNYQWSGRKSIIAMVVCYFLIGVVLPGHVSAQVQEELLNEMQNAYVTVPSDNPDLISTYYNQPQRGMTLGAMSTSLPASDLSVVARLRKANSPGPQPYRTYYKSDEAIYLEADWPYFGSWQSPWAGKTLKITYRLNSGGVNIYSYTFTTILSDTDHDLGGIAIYVNLSNLSNKIVNNMATFVVTFSVNGIVDSTASTKLYITALSFTDLPISWLSNYSQTNWFWKKDCLGDCLSGSSCIYTMGDSGCATTSKAFIFQYLGGGISPQSLNNTLRDQGGYIWYKGCHSGCPGNQKDLDGNYLNLIGAPSDVLFEEYFSTSSIGLAAVKQKIYDSLDSGFPVLLKTTLYGMHYVVAVGRRSNGQLEIFDPLDGQLHLMEKRGLTFSAITGVSLFSQ